jgi:hypothetical protein
VSLPSASSSVVGVILMGDEQIVVMMERVAEQETRRLKAADDPERTVASCDFNQRSNEREVSLTSI